jgi:hypothetical protein
MDAFTGDEGRSPLSTMRHKGVRVTGSVIAENFLVSTVSPASSEGSGVAKTGYRFSSLI